MKKRIESLTMLALVSLFVISCSSNASPNADSSDQKSINVESAETNTADYAVLEVENDTYDFGVVSEGDKVKHEYVFTNTGTTPLIINSVRASCGCTTPNYPKEPIKPGEQSKIEVVFDTSNQPGMQHKVITMLANTEDSQTIFHLKGEVK